MLRDPGEGGEAREAEKRPGFQVFMVWVLLVPIVAMLFYMGIGCVAAATVNVSTPSAADQGSTFSVTVQVLSVTDLYGAQFDLSFNPTVLQAISVDEGSFLKQGADTETFWILPTIDNSAGTIVEAAQARYNVSSGVTGSGALATISFLAKATGTSSLSLSGVKLSDSNGHAISFTTQPGSVAVLAAPPPLVPPDSQITGGPTGTISTTTATFTWAGSDTDGYVASFDYKMDSGAWETTTATSRTFTGLPKGGHTFYVQARDNDGLLDPTPASRSFTVYLTANPETKIVSGPSGTIEGDTATFEWIGTDMDGHVVSYLYSLDTQTWTPTTKTWHTFMELPYGNHTFQVKAVDDEGLEDQTPAESNFTLMPWWWEEEIDTLNQTIQGLRAEMAALEEKNVELENQAAALKGQISSLEASMATLQTQKAALDSQVQNLEAEKYQLAELVEELEGELEVANTSMTGMKSDLLAARAQVNALNQEVDTLTEGLRQTNTLLQKVLNEKAALETTVRTLEDRIADKETEVQSLETQITRLTTEKKALEAENTALRVDNANLTQTMQELFIDGRKWSQMALYFEIQALSLNRTIAEQEGKIEEQESLIEIGNGRVTELLNRTARLEDENESLTRTRRTLQARLATLESVILVLFVMVVWLIGTAAWISRQRRF